MRTLACLFLCAFIPACDQLFGLQELDTSPDASVALVGDGDARGPDAELGSGAPPDAPPQSTVTLRQTQSDVKGGQSDACNGPGVGQSRDETYARTFPLAAAFHVTTVVFLADNVNAAAGLTVKIGTYAGTTGTTTLDAAALTWTTTAMIDVPGSASSQLISVPLAGDFAAGDVLAVAVVSPGYSGAQFNVGSAAGSETLPSYFASQACGMSQPVKTDPRNGSDVGTFVIDAIGYE